MIYYVTGPLGAGKSYYAVRKMAKALIDGRAVIGNVELAPDWAERVIGHHPLARFSGRRARKEYALELRTRYLYEPSLEKLGHVRVRGRGEGRALLVLDEAHNDLNNRDWQSSENKQFLRWLTLARKYGFLVYFISQHKLNTDAGARRIATLEVRLVNFKQVTRVPVAGTPLVPIPVFQARTYLNDEAIPEAKKKALYRETFFLGWQRKLYGTHQLFELNDGDESTVWVPRSVDDVRAELRLVQGSGGGAPTRSGGALLSPHELELLPHAVDEDGNVTELEGRP